MKILETKVFSESDLVKEVLIWAFQIAVVLACAVVTAILFFQSVTMQEGSMEPTIAVGDRFFIDKVSYKFGNPQRGDILVFKTSTKEDAGMHIKRVIGLPGETIQIRDGQILIDGETYKEGKDFPAITSSGLAEEGISLEAGEYFVLGDNRNSSDGSLYADTGSVQKKNIVGKLWFVAAPLKKIGFLER